MSSSTVPSTSSRLTYCDAAKGNSATHNTGKTGWVKVEDQFFGDPKKVGKQVRAAIEQKVEDQMEQVDFLATTEIASTEVRKKDLNMTNMRLIEENSRLKKERDRIKKSVRLANVALQQHLRGTPNAEKTILDCARNVESAYELLTAKKAASVVTDTAETHPKKSIEHVLPDTEKLVKKLDQLLAAILVASKELMGSTSDKQKMKTLQTSLAGFKETQQALKDAEVQLDHSVFRKLDSLNSNVKKWEDSKIDQCHLKAIALYNGTTEDDVKATLAERKKVNDGRKVKQDKMAMEWGTAKMRSLLVDWKTTQVELNCHLLFELSLISQELSAFKTEVNQKKNLLRSSTDKDLKANEEHLKEFQKRYDAIGKRVINCRESYEKMSKALEERVANTQPELQVSKELANYTFYDSKMRESLKRELQKAYETVNKESVQMQEGMRAAWNTVSEFFDPNNKSLTHEINRFGFAVLENNGEVPTDTMYKAWYRQKNYVTSPFEKKEEVKKAD